MRGRPTNLVLTHPSLHSPVLVRTAILRRKPVGAFLDLLHGCGAWVRWRCDARNAEQNITGLGLP